MADVDLDTPASHVAPKSGISRIIIERLSDLVFAARKSERSKLQRSPA
ncbi:MAG TPA: hypothetical protein VIJ82_26715 [Streptosporangiaceae bacterium]|jgi:hypothetical protein